MQFIGSSTITIGFRSGDYRTGVTYDAKGMSSETALKELAELLRISHDASELELECRSQGGQDDDTHRE